MHAINSKAATDKRKLESAVHTVHAEIDDCLLQAKTADEKTKRAMVDAEDMANKSELESELGSVQATTGETHKAFQKAERHIKELQFQQVHDSKVHTRRSLEVTQLQDQIKTLKEQVEEAEEIAALNLAKFQKAKKDLEDANRKGTAAASSGRIGPFAM